MANIPMSDRTVAHPSPKADVSTHPISYEGTVLPHGSHVNKPQVDIQAYHPMGPYPSIHSASILEFGTPVLPHPDGLMTGTYDALRPSDLAQTTASLFFPSTHVSYAAYTPANSSLEGLQDRPLVAAPLPNDSTRNWFQEQASMIVPQVHTLQYTPVEKAPHDSDSILSGLPQALCTTTAQYQQSTLRDGPQQSQGMERAPTTTSSQSSRRAPVHGASRHGYFCEVCSREYAQPQGVARHRREMHKANLCRHCGLFKWARPYLFRKHLKKAHAHVDPDAELEEIKRNTRRATRTAANLLQERVSVPSLEYDRRARAKSQLHPLTIPLHAMTKLSPVSPSAFQPVDYDTQSELAETTIMKIKGKDVHQPEALNSPCACTPFPFTEEHSQMVNSEDLVVSTRSVQTWYQRSQCERTAAEPPSNPVTALVHISTLPVSGCPSGPIHATTKVDPSGPTYISRTLLRLADDEIQTHGLVQSPSSGGPCADIDSYGYWSRPSRGY